MDGFCGIGIYHCKSEVNIGTLFRSAIAFDANFIFTIGRRYKKQASDTTKSVKNIPYYNYKDLDDLISNLPFGCRLIGIEIGQDSKRLDDFTHPLQACYLLGAEDYGLNKKQLEKCHNIVQIPTRYCLNVATTGSIVLYDRQSKNNIRKRMYV